ncbi:MAG: DUF4340 domain-containing protein [Luteolibacter sp.]
MNKRQVITLWIIAVTLAACVALLKFTSSDGKVTTLARTTGQTLFEQFPALDVASITIEGSEGTTSIRKKNQEWVVVERDDFPANTNAVNEFIRTTAELKITRGMEAGPSLAPRFGMDENASTANDRGLKIRFADSHSNDLAVISLGKDIESGGASSQFGGTARVGRYVRNHADETAIYAVSEMFSSISDDPSRWLDDSFFSFEKIQTVSLLEKTGEQAAWKLTRDSESAEFKLVGASSDETVNTTAATPLKNFFSYARFNDVIPVAEIENRSDSQNQRVAIIETFDGFTYRLSLTTLKTAAAETEAPTSATEMLLSVEVEANLPEKREAAADESEEDAKAKDQEFADRIAKLKEKLDKETRFVGRTFLVNKSSVDPLLKERSELITQVQETAENNQQGSIQNLPGGVIATPPRTATTPPVEAVTPPIAIPPLDSAEPDDQGQENSDEEESE